MDALVKVEGGNSPEVITLHHDQQNDSLLSGIMSLRCVYALTPVTVENRLIKARYFTCCLQGGRNTAWGLWTVRGNFQRFFSSRASIEKEYPSLVWHRRAAIWTLARLEDIDSEQRERLLEKTYNHSLPERIKAIQYGK